VPCVVATGVFDGVHSGHRLLLSRARALAQQHGLQTVVCTFHPHPRTALRGEQVHLLNTLDERLALLESSGYADHLLVLPFTPELAGMTAEDFLEQMLIKRLGMRYLVMGDNHHIGSGRAGNVAQVGMLSRKLGFGLEVVTFEKTASVVSSSAIRKALLRGDAEQAADWLGYPYALTGTVVEGNRLGRTLGYPTANIRVHDASKLLPRQGVYAARVSCGAMQMAGMMYIGSRYVAGERDNAANVEVYLFDFDGNLYGREMTVEVIQFLRDPEAFHDMDSLRVRLGQDAAWARKVLSQEQKA